MNQPAATCPHHQSASSPAPASPPRPPLPLDDLPLLQTSTGQSFTRLYRRDTMAFLRELTRGGDLFRVKLFDKTVVVAAGPDAVRELVIDRAADQRKDPLMRHVAHPLLGDGLITSDGDLWRRQRKLMSPLFQPAQLAPYGEDMVALTRQRVSQWSDGATLDIASETTHITMAIAGKILFGADLTDKTDELAVALATGLAWTNDHIGSLAPLVQLAVRRGLEKLAPRAPEALRGILRRGADRLSAPITLGTEADRRMRAAVAVLDRRVQALCDERRASSETRRDVLGRLLAARDDEAGQMTDKQVRDEVITLFVAGHETTALTLAWSLYHLCRDPALYRAARAEVDALSGPPTAADLPRLALLGRVFKETMRCYPAIPLLVREMTRETTLRGHVLPEGTTVVMSPYATHHRAELWPEPDRFDPDRFIPAAEDARPRYAYLPFSSGPRICLGNHLALMEGPLVLATVLQRVDLERTSPHAIAPFFQVALRPQGGVPLRVRLRA